MALTFEEVCERLSRIDEVSLLEVLDISSSDIVEKFKDNIEDKLDILEEDSLIDNAREVGHYLKKQLEITAKENDSVIEIRGKGLFLGIELDDALKAEKTMEDMMHQGILVGKTGPKNSVIKLRPPMTFKKEHADLLVNKLNLCLGRIS